MMDNYIDILEDSLKQKTGILQQILDYCDAQESLLMVDSLSMTEFDRIVDQKDILIKKLVQIDEGFEAVYERVKNQLSDSRETYKSQLKSIQMLIADITEKSVSIQAKEQRNKAMLEQYFAKERKSMRQGMKTSKAAFDYYKSMSNASVMASSYLDQKK